MNLAIDIGNTGIKLGVFDENELINESIYGADWMKLFERFEIKRAVISKSGKNEDIETELNKRGIPFLEISHQLKLPIKLLYATPETLGSDRIAGSVGAHLYFPDCNILKIDFGTCITYDFINSANEYIGGAISPGLKMRFKALNHFTANLPLIEPEPDLQIQLTGTSTKNSVYSGVVNGITAEVDGIIKDYSVRFSNLKTMITGGDAYFFVTLLKSEIFARPHLVLQGMNAILNDNR